MPRIGELMNFNVETDDYRELILRIRRVLGQQGVQCHGRPVLPPQISGQQPDQLEWIELELSTTSHHRITLLIRRDNVYIMGYRSENSQWFEWGRNDGRTPRLIPGSTFLGYRGNYDAMGRIEGTQISRQGVVHAVNFLATANDSNYNRRAGPLCTLIIVLCEATRFDYLLDRLVGPIGNDGPIYEIETEVAQYLVTSWGDISRMLLETTVRGDSSFAFPEENPLRSWLRNPAEAAACVALLLGPVITSRRFGVSSSINTTVLAHNYNGLMPEGEPMLELFSFKILHLSGNLRGQIVVRDGLGTQSLFDGQLSVRKGDVLPLKSLKRAISACQSIVLSYDLSDPNNGFTSMFGHHRWDIFQNRWTCDTGAPKNNSSGGDDQIAMDYKIFASAWQVRWYVHFVGELDRRDLYGHVRVSYWYDNCYHQVMLFDRAWDDRVHIKTTDPVIPLVKTMTAVPLEVEVEVDAELTDFIFLFPSREMMKGKATRRFGSREFGKAESGWLTFMQNGKVNITAEWNRLSKEPRYRIRSK